MYKCECCGEEFESSWTDEEAQEECKTLFGAKPDSGFAVVCEDCYKQMGF